MIISRTPFRISFFGGGTDYPAWYRQHGGAILGTTINKYCYLTSRYLPPFFDHRIRVVYSKIDDCRTIDEISHPAVAEVLRFMGWTRGVEIHYDGDLPARSGMGSSSAFTVGLMHALYALQGYMPNKRELANKSIYIEQERLKETVGCQDQILAAHGGLNHVTISPHDEIVVRPLTLPAERIRDLNSRLMLFYTGIKRTASEVARSYIVDVPVKDACMTRIAEMVTEAVDLLNRGNDLTEFGRLLHEAWRLKKSLGSTVSTAQVEAIYEEALGAGAIGGKLLGAGGGGFMLLFVQPQDQIHVRRRLHKLIHVPFAFEFSGSQIIFFEPEEDYALQDGARVPELEALEGTREARLMLTTPVPSEASLVAPLEPAVPLQIPHR